MANEIKWVAGWTAETVLVSDGAALTTVTYSAVSAEYDNTVGLYQYAMFDMAGTWGATPAAGGYIQLHLIQDIGTGTYEDGNTSPTIAPGMHTVLSVIPIRAVSTAQLITSGPRPIIIPPNKFKIVLYNGASTTLAIHWTLAARFTSDEIQ